jgi:rSAM/selenodomain-associated transferase 1
LGNSRKTLIIFTKNPIQGEVKTRIGNEKGHEIALNIYQILLRYTKNIVTDIEAEKMVYFNKQPFDTAIWNTGEFQYSLQVKGDLGQKMEAAFKEQLSKSNKVIIIGSDCAELTKDDLETGFRLLEENDIVIGPAKDGGYYLLGMKQAYNFLFQDMPWSQSELLNKTLQTIKDKSLSFALLPEKSDIDHWEDWLNLGWTLD